MYNILLTLGSLNIVLLLEVKEFHKSIIKLSLDVSLKTFSRINLKIVNLTGYEEH